MFNLKKKKKIERGIVIQTVVSKKVYEQLQEVTKNSGLTISGLLRLMIIQHLDTPKSEASEGNLQSE